MGSRPVPPLRSLPRVVVPEAAADGPIDLPPAEVDKFRKVLRLAEGSLIAVLPNDGSLIICEFRARQAHPIEVAHPGTEPERTVILAQALAKPDKMDTIIRCCTEIGVRRFVLFPADRSVVRWEPSKLADRLHRYEAIAREAVEQSFGLRVPEVASAPSLQAVLEEHSHLLVFSEREDAPMIPASGDGAVIGPEGGWSPAELALIGDRGVSLGPRVLRVDTAAITAASLLVFGAPGR